MKSPEYKRTVSAFHVINIFICIAMNFSYSNKFAESERNISQIHPPPPQGIICAPPFHTDSITFLHKFHVLFYICTTLQMKEKFLRKDALNFGSYLELFACRLVFFLLIPASFFWFSLPV